MHSSCRYLIIENFIPPEEKNKIMNRLTFDPEEDQWKFQPLVAAERSVWFVLRFGGSPSSIRGQSEVNIIECRGQSSCVDLVILHSFSITISQLKK